MGSTHYKQYDESDIGNLLSFLAGGNEEDIPFLKANLDILSVSGLFKAKMV